MNGRRSRHKRRLEQVAGRKSAASTKTLRALDEEILSLHRERNEARREATRAFNEAVREAKQVSVTAKVAADHEFEKKRAKLIERRAREEAKAAA